MYIIVFGNYAVCNITAEEGGDTRDSGGVPGEEKLGS